MDERQLEQLIIEKDLTGQRLTLSEVEKLISVIHYEQIKTTNTIVCALELNSGFVVTASSGCIDPKNFNRELGEKRAYDKALQLLRDYEAYTILRDQERTSSLE